MKNKLFLDDMRNAPDDTWSVVRSYDEFTQFILTNGVPDFIAFDHDLGGVLINEEEKTGFDCARWCVEYGYLPKIAIVHSHNHAGAQRIMNLLVLHEVKTILSPYPIRILLGNTDNGFKGAGSIRPSTSN